MLPCDFQRVGELLICARCDRNLKTHRPPERAHAPCKAWPRWHELGHWTAFALAVAGISPSGVAWLKWKLGLQKPCGCEARKVWMNTIGGRLVTWLESRGTKE